MGFSKFEFGPIGSFQYIGGIWFGRCRRCTGKLHFGSWNSVYI